MVHITDVKNITLTEQVTDEYEQLGKEGRFSKKCIPRGYIPDFNWTIIHQDQDQANQTTGSNQGHYNPSCTHRG